MKPSNTIPTQRQLIQQNVSLREKNWFKTGGIAKFYAEPRSEDEFRQALRYAQSEGLSVFTFGDGANLLVSDEGFDGLAIRPQIDSIEFSEQTDGSWVVNVGAGVLTDSLIQTCLNKGFFGLEDFSGIPGTIGGAVFINLHYFGSMISQSFIAGNVINRHTGTITRKTVDEFKFAYNESILLTGEEYLVSATFAIHKASAFEIHYHQGRRDEIIRHRRSRYPRDHTCGSFFRNFHTDELARGNGKATHPYIAFYLDKLGVKGTLRRGGAIVSRHHANMLVTDRDDATSTDIVELAREMQRLVFKEIGLLPKLECQLLGFAQHPFEHEADLYTQPPLAQIQRTADGL